ncbi:hypothetical protein [Aliiroseovarius crassostreae]|uniref:hypothetical protein n=1 Tax=Aliiroseovarius crassostreae TaxID=154981 RepID=UPI00220384B4|nr:hypothetical protein [Aliiroseovarius crassostreae]UWP98645.1 hypothetical protein K3X53_00255 [Aliiroseovarius crassostreae]
MMRLTKWAEQIPVLTGLTAVFASWGGESAGGNVLIFECHQIFFNGKVMETVG